MSLDISSKPMCVLIDGHDSEGGLILADSHLAPVFVRRDGTHHDPGHRGRRHLEAGFGKCDIRNASLFETPQGAGAWVERTLIRRTA